MRATGRRVLRCRPHGLEVHGGVVHGGELRRGDGQCRHRARLTGATTARDARGPRPHAAENIRRANAVHPIAGLTELADAKGISLSQLALAWILAQRDDIVPIPGSRNPGRVAENVAAAAVTFTAEDLERITTLGHGVRGRRATG
ncbi:aldo/keto reductase [Curtobacterium sp. VKM Ac-1395]|uniref:aldo/keto reductase n=1 Tax=Curtobacterium sp. VKM Ac-1395 TaxID=2783815 RepID=UPI001889D95C|nr:aldo/keto reductase [Curtobacterium sp. VKM Ac-1395]MBF4589904.1 aldo/keto reductase [Curtobacterium sp. VKM Ac-1395]